jgi:hypothetical protein
MGNWRIISLNIECESAPFNNDCSTTDGGLLAQETQWLASDLAGDHKACTIAYWHQPTFTATDTSADVPDPSAPGADSVEGLAADAWWKLLYKAHDADPQWPRARLRALSADELRGAIRPAARHHPDHRRDWWRGPRHPRYRERPLQTGT